MGGRAWEDTLCYALPSDEVVPPEQSGGASFRRSLAVDIATAGRGEHPACWRFDLTQQPAGALVREQPLIRNAGISLQQAAGHMAEGGSSSLLVRLDEGELGILTDHDLRSRVVAKGVSPDTPVRDVLTTPVFTVRADQRPPMCCWQCSITASATSRFSRPARTSSASLPTSICWPLRRGDRSCFAGRSPMRGAPESYAMRGPA